MFPPTRRESSRRGSVFDRIRASVTSDSTGHHEPGMHHGSEQTTFLGRKISQNLMPAFARKASLAIAERDRDPTHMRMGETGFGGWDGEDKWRDAFFGTKLQLDEASDDELDEKFAARKLSKGKGRADWAGDLGWQKPKSDRALQRQAERREKQKRRHRSKRTMRELDDNLNAFNEFTQNGIGGSANGLDAIAGSSTTSLPSLLKTPGLVKSASTALDSDNVFLPNESTKSPAVPVGDGFDALDVMADHIFRIGCQKKKWFKAPRMGSRRDEVGTGLTIRAKIGLYRTFPVGYQLLDEFEEAISRLNPEVAIKIKSDIVTTIMKTYM